MEITQQTIDSLKGNPLLSKWEQDFIESVSDFFKKKNRVSAAQEQVLIRCIDKCSPKNKELADEWLNGYDAEKRKIALICARYYKDLGYFRNQSEAVLNAPDTYVLSREHYAKMCENTYAKRVIENVSTPFQFGLGDLAKVRSTVTSNHLVKATGSESFHYSKMKEQAVIIIDQKDPNEKPTQYKEVCCSLVANPAVRFWCEERKLKKFKR